MEMGIIINSAVRAFSESYTASDSQSNQWQPMGRQKCSIPPPRWEFQHNGESVHDRDHDSMAWIFASFPL